MSALITMGLGNGTTPGTAFSLVSVTPGVNYIDLVFSSAVSQVTGPAATPTNYTISGGGVAVQVTGVSIVAGNVRLATTECTTGASYTVSLPFAGFNDASNDAFQGPFSFAFVGVGSPPTIASARSIDARLIEVVFTSAVNSSDALTSTNYAINGGLSVVSVSQVSLSVYRLVTTRQVNGQAYTVTASNIRDAAGNAA